MDKRRVELPHHNIFDPEFVRTARLKDRCSCSWDTVGKDGKHIYIGAVCHRHDLHDEFISRQKGWFTRYRLRWESDMQLYEGIVAVGLRHGVDLTALAMTYYRSLRRFNPLYRLCRWAFKRVRRWL